MNTLANNNVDQAALKKLHSSNQTAAQLFRELATRTNSTRFSKVDSFAPRLGVNRNELIAVFKALEELNCGRFIVGRRGQPSRFEWAVALADVGKTATGKSTSIKLITDKAVSLEDEEDEVIVLKHSFQFRQDAAVTFELPSDLTTNEAERIAAFIKALPMEQV